MLPIAEEHFRRNRTTRDRWETMSSHRAHVMQLIADARGTAAKSLCLLGAGNGNDVDLAQLAHEFERITLVDLDEQALARCVERLSDDGKTVVERHAEIDLSGILPILASWESGQLPADAELNAAIKAAHSAKRPNIGTFDVVASTCVLSQLIDSIYMALAPDHPRCFELVMAVRDRHLEMVAELLRPGGAGILVTDFVATETAPEIAHMDDSQLAESTVRWINERNFFTGANPYAIRDYYRKQCGVSLGIEHVQVTAPWRWDIGAKQLAVCAVTFRRGG